MALMSHKKPSPDYFKTNLTLCCDLCIGSDSGPSLGSAFLLLYYKHHLRRLVTLSTALIWAITGRTWRASIKDAQEHRDAAHGTCASPPARAQAGMQFSAPQIRPPLPPLPPLRHPIHRHRQHSLSLVQRLLAVQPHASSPRRARRAPDPPAHRPAPPWT